MKKNILPKFLPIAAAILLATSCSKDGDNDANIVNPNPEPETIEVPVAEPQHYTLDFSLTVSNGASLSKADANAPVFPEFQDGLSYFLTITADGTQVADLPIKTIADNRRSATFVGELDFGTNAELKAAVENKTTALVASLNAAMKSVVESYSTLDDALSASYYESAAFDYEVGGVEGISLVSRCAFIEFIVADGQKKVNIDDAWYPEVGEISDNYVCVAIPVDGTKSVKTRFRKSAKEVSANTIYTITCTDVVDLGQTVEEKIILWATCNLGATSPEQYGNYYAWGEIATKTEYTDENYTASELTTDLDNAHDAVYNYEYESGKKLGDKGYRMPTEDELSSLISIGAWSNATDNPYSTAGYLVDNDYGTIFLPAAGFCKDVLDGAGEGYYWTSTCHKSDGARDLYFRFGSALIRPDYRYYGRSVRPVRCINSYKNGEGQSGVED